MDTGHFGFSQAIFREVSSDVHNHRNPLTDDEIAGKFNALAEGIATEEDIRRMQAAVDRTEEYDSVGELMSELVVGGPTS